MFLKRLERDHQIVVCPSSPGMSRPLFRLTTKAEKTFEDIFPQHIARVKKLVPGLPDATLKALLKLSEYHPLSKI